MKKIDFFCRRGIGFLLAVLLFSVGMIGCGSEQQESYMIYYTNTAGDKLVTTEYKTDTQDAETLIQECLNQMNTSKKSDQYLVIKPEDLQVEQTALEDGTASLYFNSAYTQMDTVTELMYRTAVVKTLSQIDGVDHVAFFVDGSPLVLASGQDTAQMSASDFVDDSNDGSGTVEWKDINLYFANKNGDKLVKTQTTAAYNKNVPLEKVVVEKLLAGPTDGATNPTIPSKVKLLSISVSNGVCYVNLNNAFLTDLVNVSGDLPIYSIVNSLCDLESVNKVKIMINGDSSKTFRESTSLDTLFTYNADLVSTE